MQRPHAVQFQQFLIVLPFLLQANTPRTLAVPEGGINLGWKGRPCKLVGYISLFPWKGIGFEGHVLPTIF